jgi:hypothetical protein
MKVNIIEYFIINSFDVVIYVQGREIYLHAIRPEITNIIKEKETK